MQGSLFQQHASVTLRMVVCLILSAVLMFMDKNNDHLNGVRHGVEYAVTPLRYIVNAPFDFAVWTNSHLTTHNALIDENKTLRNENFALKTQQQKLDVLKKENDRLRALLGSTNTVGEQTLVAELLTVSLDPYRQQISINKGTADNVFDGQPIINATGVMGQIIYAGSHSSTALLISDPSHAIPIRVNRTGLKSIAQGTGNATQLDLLHIPVSADIQVGDLLVSSGLGGRFPANYPVATISEINHTPGNSFATVTATPTAALAKASEVLLIWSTSDVPAENDNDTPALEEETNE